MVERCKKRTAFLNCAQAVEAHGILPFKNVTVFPMLGSSTMFLDEPLYLLEPGYDALLAR